MGFRETYGGMIETLLNEAVDEHLNADLLKEQADKLVDGLKVQVHELIDEKLVELKAAVKEGIDKIDGEDDIP